MRINRRKGEGDNDRLYGPALRNWHWREFEEEKPSGMAGKSPKQPKGRLSLKRVRKWRQTEKRAWK
jgi:hypothetical protein